MVPPKSPTLAYRAGLPTRSKDGCLTCKAKHLKCDETRPACLRCSQKGIQCGGYWQGIRWSFKHQPNLASLASHASIVQRQSSSSSRKAADRQPQNPAATTHQKYDASTTPPRDDIRSKPFEGQESRYSSPADEELRMGSGARRDELELGNSSELILRGRATTLSGVPAIASGELFDKSSAFIINWFENVCPAWSGFDSSSNPIRKIATGLWGNSITVCSSLESMSAAFMASRNPSMRQPALRLMKRATDYVQMELQIVRSQPLPQAIPTSLLFSLFGLGTTICWVDPRGLGLPFFKEARQVLNRLNQQQPALAETDVETLEFFNKCMTYCNMLLAFVHDDDDDNNRNDDLVGTSSGTSYEQSESRPLNGGDKMHEPLHPWTGVSSLSSSLFAETVRLCRKFRQYAREQYSIEPFFSVPFEDMQAERLEEKLLDLDISPDGGTSDTGDDATPSFHLALVAEAYRLASLLLLYQTFPNLVFLRLPGRVLPADDKTLLWQEWITPLSLHLVKVLHRIPPSSGSRVIQPLLYISASTGLRQQPVLNVSTSSSQSTFRLGSGFLSQPQNTASYETDAMATLSQNSNNLSSYITGFMGNGNDTPSPAMLNTGGTDETALNIGSARHFIMQRLSILESSLPPTPVVVAKELVVAIWRAYDNTAHDSLPAHWIDVMEANDLRSMFG